MIALILIIASAISLILAACDVPARRVSLGWLGMALFVLSVIAGRYGA